MDRNFKRDNKGRFVAGTVPGPGRKAGEQRYTDILADVVTPDMWAKICKRAVDDALTGDRHARRFLADYLLGRPRNVLELQGADVFLLARVLDEFRAAGVEPSVALASLAAELQEVQAQEGGTHDS